MRLFYIFRTSCLLIPLFFQVTHAQIFDCAGVVPVEGDEIALELVTRSLSSPVDVGALPGNAERLIVAALRGVLRTIDLSVDRVLQAPFLDISSRVDTRSGGCLLGFTFHPDYLRNGHVFLNYQRRSDGLVVISRFSVLPDDRDTVDPERESILVAF